MIKILSLTFLAISISGNLPAQVNQGMPNLKDIVLHFFSVYNEEALTKDGYIKFEKKKVGWCISGFKYENLKKPTFKSLLFWSKKKQQFLQLSLPPNNSRSLESAEDKLEEYNKANYLDDYEYYNYSRNLYYGYDGWDVDVIQYAENNEMTKDSVVESYARACTNYATTYFYNQFGYFTANNDTLRIPLKNNDPAPANRVKKYIEYETKAIQAYKKIAQLNPNYLTKLGDLNWRIANEQFQAYCTLRFLNYEKEGKEFLDKIDMPDSISQKGKNLLRDVKPNSILFLTDDAPTYAVWYLQCQGYRNDVIAINQDLLGLPRYVRHLDKSYHHQLFSADSSLYFNSNFDYALYNTDYATNDTISLDSFLVQVYNSPNLSKIFKDKSSILFSSDTTFKFFTKNIYMDIDTSKAKLFFETEISEQRIYPCLWRNYLFSKDMLVFDIINTNFLKKHLYFSYAPESETCITNLKAYEHIYELTSVNSTPQ